MVYQFQEVEDQVEAIPRLLVISKQWRDDKRQVNKSSVVSLVISEGLACENHLMRYQKFKIKNTKPKAEKQFSKIRLKPLWGMTKF